MSCLRWLITRSIHSACYDAGSLATASSCQLDLIGELSGTIHRLDQSRQIGARPSDVIFNIHTAMTSDFESNEKNINSD